MTVPPLCLAELRLEVLAPITGLPHFHGPHLSAMVRNCIRPYLDDANTGSVWVNPVDTGNPAFEPGDHLHFGLTFDAGFIPPVIRMIEGFDGLGKRCDTAGHFIPGKTVSLTGATCRISNRDLCSEDPVVLTAEHLMNEAERLASLDGFSMLFHSPVRITRPKGAKEPGHRYCDEGFFLGNAAHPGSIDHLIEEVRGSSHAPAGPSGLEVTGGGLVWLDIPYGTNLRKTIGGVAGCLHVAGRPDAKTAAQLVLGQYLGAGKNAAFGLGFYTIPELDTVRTMAPLRRGTTLFSRLADTDMLGRALTGLANSSPGPDGITAGELRAAGEELLEDLARRLEQGLYAPGEAKHYSLPKPAGGHRLIAVNNACDRLVFSAACAVLSPCIDRLLSDAAWAYRAGLNRKGAAKALQKAMKEGFTSGVKADIAAFFDRVDTQVLADLLAGLLPGDPLGQAVMGWIRSSGGAGLPQGNPLSPLLSNLYLARFDQEIQDRGLKLIRYADDFVIMAPEDTHPEKILERVRASLGALRLELKEEKTTLISPDAPVEFLGYTITAETIMEEDRDPDESGDWLPVFEDQVIEGAPVYLTSVCRGAFSSGPHLVIKDSDQGTLSISWNQVSRLVVVGRSSFSGGVVYRAVREGIPAAFIDVMGRLKGRLHPTGYLPASLRARQTEFIEDAAGCLDFSRQIIAAKIHNSRVVLARSNITCRELADMEQKALEAADLDSLRGYEGMAARVYFQHLAELVRPFPFEGRVYRPPRGPVNVLLSFGYTLLYNRMSSVLHEHGFDPRIGIFHQGRGTHEALASDLMEELRHVVERVVLALVHLKAIGEDSFTVDSRGLARLTGEGFRRFIARWEQTMSTTFSIGSARKISCNGYLDEAAGALRRMLILGLPYKPLRIY